MTDQTSETQAQEDYSKANPVSTLINQYGHGKDILILTTKDKPNDKKSVPQLGHYVAFLDAIWSNPGELRGNGILFVEAKSVLLRYAHNLKSGVSGTREFELANKLEKMFNTHNDD